MSINCAALAESVLESELFGVEAGVATGVKRRAGLFVQADTGTLFLDEVGDMPMTMQAKILRVLQERRVRPVGARKSIEIDVRIVCATNKNLWDEVRHGRFREDLLFRLDVITLELPPLRDRIEDIPVLARFFLKKHAGEMTVPVPGISLGAYRLLSQYPWPGNVRELENQMHRSLVLTEIGKDIEPDQLSPRIRGEQGSDMLKANRQIDPPSVPGQEAASESTLVPGKTMDHVIPIAENLNLKEAVSTLEELLIRQALEKTNGNKTEAARLLGLSREGLRLKLQRLEP